MNGRCIVDLSTCSCRRVGATEATIPWVSREHFEPARRFYSPGRNLGDRIYIIAKGHAEVVHHDNGSDILLARLGPGEYFGEMALLNQTTRNATVRCREPLDVLKYPQTRVQRPGSQLAGDA